MSKTYETTIRINARREEIWGLLTDAAGYARWNSTVTRVTGEISLGRQVRIFAKANKGRPITVRVTEYLAPNRMVWTGGMPLGLFRGRRIFTLDRHDGAVTFCMQETFSGPLAPLMCKLIPDLTDSFKQFAADLKAQAEAISK